MIKTFFKKKKIIVLPLALAMAFSTFFAFEVPAWAGDVVVIVNQENTVSDIQLNDLKKIYLSKKKRWDNGVDIEVLLPASGSDLMDALLSNALKISTEADLKKYYLTAIFQQTITMIPVSAADSRDAASKVARSKGAVAVVHESEIPAYPGIKIIRVEGL